MHGVLFLLTTDLLFSLSLSLSLSLSISQTKFNRWETKYDSRRETKHESLNVWNGNNNKEITTNTNFSSLYQSEKE